MLGASKFASYGFTLTKVSKGRNSWKEFDENLQNPDLEKCNAHTKKHSKARDEEKINKKSLPELGTPDFDRVSPPNLCFHMEHLFKEGEISTYD